jgi:heme/copper-type cytochrome/quinol oxidase subunit 2
MILCVRSFFVRYFFVSLVVQNVCEMCTSTCALWIVCILILFIILTFYERGWERTVSLPRYERNAKLHDCTNTLHSVHLYALLHVFVHLLFKCNQLDRHTKKQEKIKTFVVCWKNTIIYHRGIASFFFFAFIAFIYIKCEKIYIVFVHEWLGMIHLERN